MCNLLKTKYAHFCRDVPSIIGFVTCIYNHSHTLDFAVLKMHVSAFVVIKKHQNSQEKYSFQKYPNSIKISSPIRIRQWLIVLQLPMTFKSLRKFFFEFEYFLERILSFLRIWHASICENQLYLKVTFGINPSLRSLSSANRTAAAELKKLLECNWIFSVDSGTLINNIPTFTSYCFKKIYEGFEL